jgi:ferritin-like metal-binding protein YciE
MAAPGPIHEDQRFTTMTIASPTDIFFDQLRDLNSATRQTAATLPDLANWASEEKLAAILREHHAATRRHQQEIAAIFEAHGVEAGNDVCKAMEGLIEGGNKHIKIADDPAIRDLLLIAHSNRIAHYLIAAADYTRGIAEKCGLGLETEAVADILTAECAFAEDLSELALGVFDLKIGGFP